MLLPYKELSDFLIASSPPVPRDGVLKLGLLVFVHIRNLCPMNKINIIIFTSLYLNANKKYPVGIT